MSDDKKNENFLEQVTKDIQNVDTEVKESVSEVKRLEKLVKLVLNRIEMYSGPIPPADEMAKYNEIAPDLVNRIMLLTENEQKSRHKSDDRELNIMGRNSLLGIISAFSISTLFGILSFILILNGHAVAGSVLGVGVLGSLVTTFIYGTKNINKKR